MLRQLGGWLRSSHSFKECVIAHQSSAAAPIMVGTLSRPPKQRTLSSSEEGVVGERSRSNEAGAEAFRWSDGK